MARSHRIARTVLFILSKNILSKTNSFNQKQRKFRIPHSAYSVFPLFRIPYFRATLIFRSSTWRPFTCKS
jgi:hypothetical protein